MPTGCRRLTRLRPRPSNRCFTIRDRPGWKRTTSFPFLPDSRIDKLEIEVNGKMTAAELRDAEQVSGIYEDIV